MEINKKHEATNDITLKEYFNVKISTIEKSTDLAREQMDKRLEGMNEFRDQLKDQASRFVTREEVDAKLEGINKNKKDNTTLVLSIIGIIIAVLSLIAKSI